jgi:hypothetical protein
MLFYRFHWLLPAGLLLTIPLVQAQIILEEPSTATTLEYRAAIGQYHGFKDQPIVSWRDANDTVGKAGGMGANDASQPASTEKNAAPVAPGHGANGAMPKGMSGSPMNHGGKP